MEEVIPSPHAMQTPTWQWHCPEYRCRSTPIGKMMRRHGSNGNRHSKRESIAKHPEDEDGSQFAQFEECAF
jgi:hypothetical protein